VRTRLHPYLVIALICFGLIVLTLALASCGTTAPRPTAAKTSVEAPLVVGGMGQVGKDVGPDIYPCDPRCASRGVSYTLPDPGLAGCYQMAAAEWLANELAAGRIATKWPPAEAAGRVRWNHPQVRYGACPLWVEGAIGPDPYVGCAAGVAWGTSLYVSLGEPERVYKLHSWETSNAHLAWSLDLSHLADGPITAAATEYATATCGTTVRKPLVTP